MNRSSTIAGVCLIALSFALSSVHGAITLPTLQGFEGGWTAGGDWAQAGGGLVAADPSHVAGLSGAIISNDMLTASFAGSPTNVWFQIWSRPVVGSSDPSATGASGAFYVDSGGHLMVYDTNGWQSVASGFPTSGNTWIGFVVHIDYTAHKWDIYYSKTYTNTFTKANSFPLTLPTSVAGLTSIAVESGNAAYVDQWAVSKGFSSAPSSFSKVLAYELAGVWDQTSFQLPAYSDAYTNGNADTLLGTLGDDLRTMIYNTSDKIKLRVGAGANEWGAYMLNPAGTMWMEDPSSNADPIGGKHFTIADKIWLDHASGPDAVGFFPYNALIAVDGSLVAGHPAVTLPDISLYGMGGGSSSGYTALNWPANVNNVNDLPIDNPDAALEDGDILYVAVPGHPGTYDTYIWSNAKGWTGAGSTSVDVPAAADLWLRKQGVNGTIAPSF